MKILAIIALAFGLTACPRPLPDPRPPTPDVDAGALLDGGVPSCDTVCGHGAELGCDWARPTQNGVPCSTVCENANRVDGPIRWNLACRSRARSCPSADLCP